jgi:hypothetical protein
MSLFNRSSRSLFRRAWKPLHFSSKGFILIPADKKFKEETIPDYVASHFYPVRIGEILWARFQVVGKLGVWYYLDCVASTGSKVCFITCRRVAHARSSFASSECRHVALKLFIG